jgi:hypothetical protein
VAPLGAHPNLASAIGAGEERIERMRTLIARFRSAGIGHERLTALPCHHAVGTYEHALRRHCFRYRALASGKFPRSFNKFLTPHERLTAQLPAQRTYAMVPTFLLEAAPASINSTRWSAPQWGVGQVVCSSGQTAIGAVMATKSRRSVLSLPIPLLASIQRNGSIPRRSRRISNKTVSATASNFREPIFAKSVSSSPPQLQYSVFRCASHATTVENPDTAIKKSRSTLATFLCKALPGCLPLKLSLRRRSYWGFSPGDLPRCAGTDPSCCQSSPGAHPSLQVHSSFWVNPRTVTRSLTRGRGVYDKDVVDFLPFQTLGHLTRGRPPTATKWIIPARVEHHHTHACTAERLQREIELDRLVLKVAGSQPIRRQLE